MRFGVILAGLLVVAGCASSGKTGDSARLARYESHCASSGVAAGSVAMQNCVYEKYKEYQNRRAQQAMREQARRQEVIRRNTMIDSR